MSYLSKRQLDILRNLKTELPKKTEFIEFVDYHRIVCNNSINGVRLNCFGDDVLIYFPGVDYYKDEKLIVAATLEVRITEEYYSNPDQRYWSRKSRDIGSLYETFIAEEIYDYIVEEYFEYN
jgi:hypothetical protein